MTTVLDWVWPESRDGFQRVAIWTLILGLLHSSAYMIAITVLVSGVASEVFLNWFFIYILLILLMWFVRYHSTSSVLHLIDDINTQVRARIGASLLYLSLLDFDRSDTDFARQALAQLPRLTTESAVLLDRVFTHCSIQFFSFVLVFIFYADTPVVQLSYGAAFIVAVLGGTAIVIIGESSRSVFTGKEESGFADLTDGFKEVRLDPRLREKLLTDVIYPRVDESVNGHRRIQNHASYAFTGLESVSLLTVVILVALPDSILPAASDQGLRIAMVAILIPASLFFELPKFLRLRRTFLAFRNLINELEQRNTGGPPWLQDSPPRRMKSTLDHGLVVRDVAFTFPSTDGIAGFSVGPVSFQVPTGSITFFTGGNGSGKSTVLNTVIGLYPRDRGVVLVDGVELPALADSGHFSAIFTDSYLFARPYGYRDLKDDHVNALFERFQIAHKVRLERGRLTTTDLSTGQRKRAALALAMAEDRPIWALDEWAADQDPEFRDWFYCELLPAERARGRTIIVVTHDEPYFQLADQILHFEYGKAFSG